MNLITPATPLIESTIKLGQEAFEDEPEYPKAMKGIPVVGTVSTTGLVEGLKGLMKG